jgi:hypothetical protein
VTGSGGDTVRAQAEARIADLLPAGHIPIGFAVSIKALDEAGELCLVNTRSQEITAWEAVGMLTSAADDVRAAMREAQDQGGE